MEFETLEKLPNKEFAFKCLTLLQNNGGLDDKVLATLTDIDECKRLFCFSSNRFSILREIKSGFTTEELQEQRRDTSGKYRYYKDVLVLNNKQYIVTNHWYGPNKSMPDNRTPFLTWIKSKVL